MPRSALATGLIALLTLTLAPGFGHAVPVQNTTGGLPSPAAIVTFSELVFSPTTIIRNEFASFGVTFSPYLSYDSQGATTCCDGIVGHYLGNNDRTTLGTADPFSILFTSPQPAAAFGLATNPATTTFDALLAGTVVESFTSQTTDETGVQNNQPVFFGRLAGE